MISIIIPVYNLEEYIIDTLESIIVQDIFNCEIIVINDGSTDNSKEVIETYIEKNKDKNIKLIDKDNSGVSDSRNIGLKLANKEYIMFLDGDDFLDIKFMNKVKKTLQEKNSDVIYFGFNDYMDGKIIKRYSDYGFKLDTNIVHGEVALEEKLSKNIWICTGTAIYKRSMLESAGIEYSKGVCYGEDIEFINKALSNAKTVKGINENLVYIRERKGSAIHSTFNKKMMSSLKANENLYKYIQDKDFHYGDKEKILYLINIEYKALEKYICGFLFDSYNITDYKDAKKIISDNNLIDNKKQINYETYIKYFNNRKEYFNIKLLNRFTFIYFLIYKTKTLIRKYIF